MLDDHTARTDVDARPFRCGRLVSFEGRRKSGRPRLPSTCHPRNALHRAQGKTRAMVHSRLRRAVCWLTGGLLVAAFAIFAACRWGNVGATAEPLEEAAAPPIFQVIEPGDSGVNHLFRVGEEAGHFGILEALGGGAAVFDFDGDGLMDIFLTGGGYYTGKGHRTIRGQPCKLYKNLGGWKFRDVQ